MPVIGRRGPPAAWSRLEVGRKQTSSLTSRHQGAASMYDWMRLKLGASGANIVSRSVRVEGPTLLDYLGGKREAYPFLARHAPSYRTLVAERLFAQGRVGSPDSVTESRCHATRKLDRGRGR